MKFAFLAILLLLNASAFANPVSCDNLGTFLFNGDAVEIVWAPAIAGSVNFNDIASLVWDIGSDSLWQPNKLGGTIEFKRDTENKITIEYRLPDVASGSASCNEI